MPNLLTGDRLVVSKYPYGWSCVSPDLPHPAHPATVWQASLDVTCFKAEHARSAATSSSSPRPAASDDYIKRVIGLPGDTIEVRDGRLIINGKPVKRRAPAAGDDPGRCQCAVRHDEFSGCQVRDRDGRLSAACRSSARRFPTASPMTRSTSAAARATISAPIRVPAGHLFLMGDNRDRSADSRFSLAAEQGLGGPVPWENIGGRAEFITFSLDGTTQIFNPVTWFRRLPRRAAPATRCGPTEGLDRMAEPTEPTDPPRRTARSRRISAIPVIRGRSAQGGRLARHGAAHRRRHRPRPAAAADHRRNGLRGHPRRRRAPARPGAADRPRLAPG